MCECICRVYSVQQDNLGNTRDKTLENDPSSQKNSDTWLSKLKQWKIECHSAGEKEIERYANMAREMAEY